MSKNKKKIKIEYFLKNYYKGGNISLVKIDIASINKIKGYVNDSKEWCGKFILDDNINLDNNYINLKIDEANIVEGVRENSRDLCYVPSSEYIWHTHPILNRGLRENGTELGPASQYPSYEDIIKVLKHNDINMSFIFCYQGYWILNRNGIYDNFNDIGIKNVIDHYNNKLYFSTDPQVRILCINKIREYVTNINEKLQSTGLIIDFKLYN